MTGTPSQSDVPAVLEAPQAQYAGGYIGRYDVINLVGRGSTGDVYAGYDRELARPVALKFMSPESFIREARAASARNHPDIVTVHEVVSWKSLPVIVMEFVEGKLVALPHPRQLLKC